jgi:hypothetical protein
MVDQSWSLSKWLVLQAFCFQASVFVRVAFCFYALHLPLSIGQDLVGSTVHVFGLERRMVRIFQSFFA